MKTAPAIRPRLFVRATTAASVVTTKSNAAYTFALRSKVQWPGWTRSPREKAPRMFEMEEPTTLPTARDERRWRIAAKTTASCRAN
ncbi:uncharacterized protein SPSK_03797 [Sporothrix schenckii 1099-18]|uniref:Uncharacterized protein n=1 Tax=Sporothrix schenckii 1099-18 TaxID=1397361 RepID=A0A0F2M051_SPOSC|nr:uncharacterized protein SPSK_03797 [Sporothrix schenckii 1099-18]KJR82140.1 hypothetical protein SPSK_03797 [Sporothrix schenckii 1099-18]